MEEFAFEDAVRKSSPMLLSVSGTSGSGKTYSAILIAAGIAGPNGKVGLIDAENGRGSMYADDPGIRAALPQGYRRTQIDAPYSPQRYIKAIAAAENAGVDVLVIDSTSHEWEGIGGCTDIADQMRIKKSNGTLGKENWAAAKREHKKFVYRALSSNMHIIFCLRAREKVKMTGDTVVALGIQPVAEKNFVFEMLLSLQLDEPTHKASAIKIPAALKYLFEGGPRLLTKADGEAIRKWNDGGASLEAHERLRARARAMAEEGMAAYVEFFGGLSTSDKNALKATDHEQNKKFAKDADDARALETTEREEEPATSVAA